MSKIDPRLKFLRSQEPEELGEIESLGRFAIEVREIPSPKVTLLVNFTDDIQKLEEKGFETRTVAGDIATGLIELDNLDDLDSLESVVKIESSRPMMSELDISVAEINADQVHNLPPGHKGSGVIVGIIDTGIFYPHQCFRKQDGTSRILAIWDQYLTRTGAEQYPLGYNYGVEYTKTDIDAALSASNPFNIVRHNDHDTQSGHGSHVSGIAAGNGSVAGDGNPAFTYVGVAPEADIIMVANRVTSEALGDSAGTLDAINYIFDKATSLGKPVVINLSQGDNLGPHDGTSLLERGIDNLLGGIGKSMVKSAGNAADDDIHAEGTVTAGGNEKVQFVIPANDTSPDTIDIWYSHQDRFNIFITVPGGNVSSTVNPGTTTTLTLPNGNKAFIDSVLNDPGNNENRIYIQLLRGTRTAIEQGTWDFTLSGTTVVDSKYNAWIERGMIVPKFNGPQLSKNKTISVPGTSKEIIAVASYITRGTNTGDLSKFSSRGPTSDDRLKPEIAAPGQRIISVKARGTGTDQYASLSGTSMASPHIAGTIALMFQVNKSLSQTQIKDCLIQTARSDSFTGVVPNNSWGYGKVDSKRAFECAKKNGKLYTLSINIIGQGSVNKDPDQITYMDGTIVQLTANPRIGYTFQGWSGDLTGTSSSSNITMNDNKNVTARFTNCVITAVTLGSILVPQVQFLRVYRDEIVLKSMFKKLYVKLLERYYQYSPYIVTMTKKLDKYGKFIKYFVAYPLIIGGSGVALLTQGINKIRKL
jgi:uncharacterized repeat protein (TIGR02543 family)